MEGVYKTLNLQTPTGFILAEPVEAGMSDLWIAVYVLTFLVVFPLVWSLRARYRAWKRRRE
jgi:hypothetical protein